MTPATATHTIYTVNGAKVATLHDAYNAAVALLLDGVQVEVLSTSDGPTVWDATGRHAGKPSLLQQFTSAVAPTGGAWSTTTFPAWFWRQLPAATQSALQALPAA
jgi:hypothetical protein